MHGFKKGAKPKAQRYADGGRVRGPGTGTSDDIETEVPQGSYIMPADSTEQIGEGQLDAMGKPVPVNLSNGEYQLPPEQVHAVGVQALDQMKAATHTPAAEQGAGMGFQTQGGNAGETEMFFADGGLVDEEKKRQNSFDITNTPAAQVQAGAIANPEAATPVPGNPARAARMQAQFDQPVTGPNGVVGAASAPMGFMPKARTEGSGWRTDSVLAGTGEDVSRLAGQGQYAQALGAGVRGTAAAIPAAFLDAGQDVANVAGAIAQPVMNFGKGLLGMEDSAAQPARAAPAALAKPVAQPAAPAPAAKTPPAPTQAPAAQAPAVTAAQPAVGAPGVNDITRVGNSFSGTSIGPGYTINGQPSGTSSAPRSPQNEAAVQALFARTPEFGAGTPAAEGFTPGGPRVTVIGDSSRAGRDRQRVIDAASTPYAGAQNRQLTANQLRTLSGLQESDDRNATSLAAAGMNNDASLQRAALGEQGANGRAALQEGGQNARFSASNQIDQQRLAGEQEARGFQTRAAQRVEKLYEKYDKAKPEERAALAEQIRVLTGKEQAARYAVAAGGQEVDPTTQQLVTRPAVVYNQQTGEIVTSGAQRQAQPAARPVGTTSTVNGKTAVWDGSKWIPR